MFEFECSQRRVCTFIAKMLFLRRKLFRFFPTHNNFCKSIIEPAGFGKFLFNIKYRCYYFQHICAGVGTFEKGV